MAALGVAILLIGARPWLGATNVAFVLAVVVVAAGAVGGRGAGLLTGVMAALSFDFFHTEPYRTLKMTEHRDVITTLLLSVIGLAVGELAARLETIGAERRIDREGTRRLHRFAELIINGAPQSLLISTAEREVADELHLREAAFLRRYNPTGLPVLGHDGSFPASVPMRWVGRGFSLPPQGVEVPVVYRGDVLGRLVLVPSEHAVVRPTQRLVVVAIADQLAAALGGPYRQPGSPPVVSP